jgi:biopolymer transport protein ExbB/TolQ
MNLYALLQAALYLISSDLLYPVMALLIALFIWIIINTGGFVAEWVERKQRAENPDLDRLIDKLLERTEDLPSPAFDTLNPINLPAFPLKSYIKGLMAELLKDQENLDLRVECHLQEKELELSRSLDKIRLLIRLGPCLGLMGTLIPIGSALAELSQGNLERLANNLIIAFTTTVVGLAIGGIAFLIGIIREGWIRKDIIQMEYIAEAIMRKYIDRRGGK